MRKITLILISLFVLVIGIGCAAAADLDSFSTADHQVTVDSGVNDIGSGELAARPFKLSDPNVIGEELARPTRLSDPNVIGEDLERPGMSKDNLGDRRTPRGSSDDLATQPIIHAPIIGSGLGGGGNENFF